MSKQEQIKKANDLALVLEADLLRLYGPMLTGDSLRQALGYSTMDALRQAIFRKTIPIPLFQLENRRGRFALVKDVASWLAEERENAVKK